MINDLSQILKNILDAPSLPEPLQSAQIEFDQPTEGYTPAGGRRTINLFLYDIRENIELRSNESIVERLNGQAVVHRAPVRVDCSYLVTAWPDGAGQAKFLQEHQLLSQVLQVLSSFPTIPAPLLAGTSLDGQEPPLPVLTARTDGLSNPSDFWTALGNHLRASISVKVTISVDVFAAGTGPLVTTIATGFEQGEGGRRDRLLQIGGRILSGPGQGIADALVDITDAGLRTRTDTEGSYSFSRVPAGPRTIRVVAVGFQPETRVVDVPGKPEDYDITLTPL
jgi:hypothetical protein